MQPSMQNEHDKDTKGVEDNEGGHTQHYAYDTPFPFGHSCMYSEPNATFNAHLGCDNKGDWSCDFEYEATLRRIGTSHLHSSIPPPLTSHLETWRQ